MQGKRAVQLHANGGKEAFSQSLKWVTRYTSRSFFQGQRSTVLLPLHYTVAF